MADPKLSIVVPVYNGAATIGELVEALRALEIEGGLEIVLAVDGSPDDSLEVCKQLAAEPGAPVTVLSLSRNFGEHNAVMAGLSRARGAFTITMDDDLQNPPAEVRRLFEHARNGNYDAVYTYYAEKKHAPWRNLGSRFTNWCADRLIDKPRGLYLSSFRCISGFVREHITAGYEGPFPYVDGLVFQVTQNVGRLQVEHLPRIEGRSNYTLARLFRLWLSMFLNFSVIPLRFATLFGIAFGALGLYGWRGNAKWLALGWALHPLWDFPLHYIGPGRSFAPWAYTIACISYDWVVAAYIFIFYRVASRRVLSPER